MSVARLPAGEERRRAERRARCGWCPTRGSPVGARNQPGGSARAGAAPAPPPATGPRPRRTVSFTAKRDILNTGAFCFKSTYKNYLSFFFILLFYNPQHQREVIRKGTYQL